MPKIDPTVTFWISIAIAVAGVGSNAALWAGAIPSAVIPMVAQWNHIIDVTGQVVLPILLGQNMTTQGRIAAARNDTSITQIGVATPAIAAAANDDKVVHLAA